MLLNHNFQNSIHLKKSYLIANLKYLHMCLHDEKETQMEHVFSTIFNFIETATVPESHSPTKLRA